MPGGKAGRRAAAAVAGLLAAAPAAAMLGGARATIDADRAHFAATRTVAAAATHTVHTLTLANGGTVREFEGPDGMVFALAWSGPSRPDLRQLLGDAFAAVQTTAGAGRRPRQAMTVSRGDLVVHSGGHPGGFHGFAYLPQHLPAAFAADALD